MDKGDHGIDIVRRWRHSFPVAAILPACVNSLIRRTWAPGIRIFDSDLVVSASRPPSAAEKRCDRHPRAPNEPACIHRCHVKPVTGSDPQPGGCDQSSGSRRRPWNRLASTRPHLVAGHKQAGHEVCETPLRRPPHGPGAPGLHPATKTAGQPVARAVSTAGAAGCFNYSGSRRFVTSPAPGAASLEPSATVSVTLAVTPLRHRGETARSGRFAPSRWTAANAAAPLIHRPVSPAGYADR